MTWYDTIRLKNVLSEGYLDLESHTATGVYGVNQERSSSNLISFEAAVDVDSEMIEYSTPIYVKGVQEQWLHATEQTTVVDEQSRQRYHAVDFIDTKRDENAFNMQLVDLKDVQDLSWAKADCTTLQRMFGAWLVEFVFWGRVCLVLL